jgi:hypothetical protein
VLDGQMPYSNLLAGALADVVGRAHPSSPTPKVMI